MPFEKGNKWGKIGGRPKATRTISAEMAREYITKRVVEELEPIIDTAIAQAKQGDKSAREELLNRSLGTPKQSFEVDMPKEREAIDRLSEQVRQMILNDKATRQRTEPLS